MKRFLEIAIITGLSTVLLFTAFWCLRPILKNGSSCSHRELGQFCDFTMRMNEAECLRLGVDPYDVWSEKVSFPPYFSNTPHKPVSYADGKMTNAYVPWEYALALPLSMPPRWMGWLVYCALMLAAAAVVVLLPIKTSAGSDCKADVLPSLAALAFVVYPLWSNAGVGNLAVFSLAGAVGMAWCLNRGKDVLAGICWSVVMLKPQLGLPFAIPLLMRMKWKTCITAVLVCVITSIPSSMLCGKSFVGMILHAPEASASFFEGCATWPRFLCADPANTMDIVSGTAIGALAGVVMTWMLRKEKCWFDYLMPAAVVSCCWTYTQAFSHAMAWFVAFVLVRELMLRPESRFLRGMLIVSFLSLTRWFLAWHGFCAFSGHRFPMSEYAYRCFDSINSTVSLSIAVAICVWKHHAENSASTKEMEV